MNIHEKNCESTSIQKWLTPPRCVSAWNISVRFIKLPLIEKHHVFWIRRSRFGIKKMQTEYYMLKRNVQIKVNFQYNIWCWSYLFLFSFYMFCDTLCLQYVDRRIVKSKILFRILSFGNWYFQFFFSYKPMQRFELFRVLMFAFDCQTQ